jgi:predicted O-methyltransferase YrrM
MDESLRYQIPNTAAGQRAFECLSRLNTTPEPICVEIGVFQGAMSVILLAARPDMRLFLIDPYETYQQSDEYKASNDFHTEMSPDAHKAARYMAKMRTEFAAHRREFVIQPSVEAATHLLGAYDLVFIDGDHSYKGCKEDIEAWWPLVKTGGYLSGHDYRTDKPGFGVKQAVDEAFPFAEKGQNYTWFQRKNA